MLLAILTLTSAAAGAPASFLLSITLVQNSFDD